MRKQRAESPSAPADQPAADIGEDTCNLSNDSEPALYRATEHHE